MKKLGGRRTNTTTPTARQKMAIKILVEEGGSVSGAMRKAGYSVETAKTPSKLTSTPAWKELMEKYLPDLLLAQKHRELLTTNIKRRRTDNGAVIEESIDVAALSRGLDMAYKLKGIYAAEKKEISGNLSLSALLGEVNKKDENEGLLIDAD